MCLYKRGSLDIETDTQWGKTTWRYSKNSIFKPQMSEDTRIQGRGCNLPSQPLEETKPGNTLILDFQPTGLCNNKLLFLKGPSLWYFVFMAALETNECTFKTGSLKKLTIALRKASDIFSCVFQLGDPLKLVWGTWFMVLCYSRPRKPRGCIKTETQGDSVCSLELCAMWTFKHVISHISSLICPFVTKWLTF